MSLARIHGGRLRAFGACVAHAARKLNPIWTDRPEGWPVWALGLSDATMDAAWTNAMERLAAGDPTEAERLAEGGLPMGFLGLSTLKRGEHGKIEDMLKGGADGEGARAWGGRDGWERVAGILGRVDTAWGWDTGMHESLLCLLGFLLSGGDAGGMRGRSYTEVLADRHWLLATCGEAAEALDGDGDFDRMREIGILAVGVSMEAGGSVDGLSEEVGNLKSVWWSASDGKRTEGKDGLAAGLAEALSGLGEDGGRLLGELAWVGTWRPERTTEAAAEAWAGVTTDKWPEMERLSKSEMERSLIAEGVASGEGRGTRVRL